jgi:hypothetical protein
VRKGDVDEAQTFGAKAIAALSVLKTGTGSALDALLSRMIEWDMTKPPAGVQLHKLREAVGEYQGQRVDGRDVGRRLGLLLADWAAQERDALASLVPEVPDGVALRNEELWLPLLAVAAVAEANRQARADEDKRGEGDDWAELAWAACVDMSLYGGTPDTTASEAEMLAGIMNDWED